MGRSFTTAGQVKVGDIVECICEQGCVGPSPFIGNAEGACQNHCPKNPCTGKSQTSWEKVIDIQFQPALSDVWIYFFLTNNKKFGAWSKQFINIYV